MLAHATHRYQWSLVTGPEIETSESLGMRFQAKPKSEIIQGRRRNVYESEEQPIKMSSTGDLLVRIVIGEVADPKRLLTLVRWAPLRVGELGWNSAGWVRDVLDYLDEAQPPVLRNSVLDKGLVCDKTMQFVNQKTVENRLNGAQNGNRSHTATYSLLEQQEVFP